MKNEKREMRIPKYTAGLDAQGYLIIAPKHQRKDVLLNYFFSARFQIRESRRIF